MGLGVTFTARDAMSGVLFRLQRAFGGLETQSRTAIQAIGAGFAGMAAGIGMVTAGLGGLEASMALAGKAGRFEAEMTRVGQVAQVGGQELEKMSQSAMAASQRTGRATSEVNKGIEEIAALGFSGRETLDMLNPALNLAAAGGVGFADSASAMGAAMKVFSISASPENMKRVASSLIGISNITGLQASDLRIALGTVGRGASIAKQDLNEVLIMMGLVKNTGVDATVAASSVSSALLYMAENAGKFKKIGIDVEDANGKIRKAGDIFVDLFSQLQSNPSMSENVTIVKDLLQRFGITAYSGVTEQLFGAGIKDDATNTIYKGADALDYLRKKMVGFQDTSVIDKISGAMLATYDAFSTRLGNSWENLLTELGKGFKDLFLPALKLLVEGLVRIQQFIAEIPPDMKKFLAGLFVAGSIMTVTAGISMILAGAIAVLVGAVMIGGPVVLTFLGGFLAIAVPLALATAVLTGALLAFGAGLYLVFSQNLGGATDKVVAFFSKWKTVFQSVAAFLTEGKLTGALATEFEGLDVETQDMIVNFTLFFEKLKAGFLAFTDTLTLLLDDRAGPALTRIWEAFTKLTDTLGITDSAYGKMTKAMSKGDFEAQGKLIAESVAGAFIFLCDTFVFLLKLGTAVIEMFKTIWNNKFAIMGGIAGSIAGPAGFIAGAVGGAAVDAAGTMMDPGVVPPTVDTEELNSLEHRLEAIKLRRGDYAQSPATTVASLSGEQQIRGYEMLLKKYQKSQDPNAPVYVVDNKLYIDGQIVYESVKRAQRDEAAASHTENPWSGAF